ncbi:MAG: hypothetical protein ACYDIC_09715 [Desulfobaccales bacterium]
MGLVASIQSLNQSAWPEKELGQGRAASKSAAGRPRLGNPAGIETPEEALTYINQLYQDGRTGELVGLLRGNAVFREAWQTLQQSASNGSDPTGGLAATPAAAASTPEQSTLPVPFPAQGPAGQRTNPDPGAGQVTATQVFSPALETTPNYPVPTPKPSYALTAGRQVYESQARYFSQESGDSRTVSIRV